MVVESESVHFNKKNFHNCGTAMWNNAYFKWTQLCNCKSDNRKNQIFLYTEKANIHQILKKIYFTLLH
jgi:hypothetical protein